MPRKTSASNRSRNTKDSKNHTKGDHEDEELVSKLTELSQSSALSIPRPVSADGTKLPFNFRNLALKPDHTSRPFWVRPDGSILLEAFSPLYEQARDFLVAICEPTSRPEFIHEYRLDKNALFAAASMGLTADIIVNALAKLSKVPLDDRVSEFVRTCTLGYGKVKLVLERGRYYIESSYPSVLRFLVQHPVIRRARVMHNESDLLQGGKDSENARMYSNDGFLVRSDLQEQEASLGLKGIIDSTNGSKQSDSHSSSMAKSGSLARNRTGSGLIVNGINTGRGLLAERMDGEVNSDEEEFTADSQNTASQASGQSTQGKANTLTQVAQEDTNKRTALTKQQQFAIECGGFHVDDSWCLISPELTMSSSMRYLQRLLGFHFNETAEKLVDAYDFFGSSGTQPNYPNLKELLARALPVNSSDGQASFEQYSGQVSANRILRALNAAQQIKPSTSGSSSAVVRQFRNLKPVLEEHARLKRREKARLKQAEFALARAQREKEQQANQLRERNMSEHEARQSRHVRRKRDLSDYVEADTLNLSDNDDADSIPKDAKPVESAIYDKQTQAKRRRTEVVVNQPQSEASDSDYSDSETKVEANNAFSKTKAVDDHDIDHGYDEVDTEELQALQDDAKRAIGEGFAVGSFKPKDIRLKSDHTKQDDDDDFIDDLHNLDESNIISTSKKLSKYEKAKQEALQEIKHGRTESGQVLRFEINAEQVDDVKKACLSMDPPYPMLHEYDFRGDTFSVPNLDIELQRPDLLRPYQAKSLAKMFGNGRARSGMIVLPCGAGKTLVGISAAATMKKSALVFCPNSTSVDQWVEQFKRFSTVHPSLLIRLTAKHKSPLPPPDKACIILTTYSMIGAGGARAATTHALLRDIAAREWGLMLLDETHQVVANTFQRVLKLRAHCRLGLTATLVREDGRDRDLSHLVGPKLYEANWMDLTRGGYLANVEICEVWCPMTREFYREYLKSSSAAKKRVLATMNPTKCYAMHRLLEIHKNRPGDKVIVFSESVFALKLYAAKFGYPVISGETPERDREDYIHAFRTKDAVNVLFLSRVGDVALDVPDANVIIQISSHFGSRLQEAQRMGRILRRGKQQKLASHFNAFFYTLISTDTIEVYFSNKRRRYLVDQGYAYKVITSTPHLSPTEEALKKGCPFMVDEEERLGVLRQVLLSSSVEADEERESKMFNEYNADLDDGTRPSSYLARLEQSRVSANTNAPDVGVHHSVGSMAALSGGTGLRYIEYSASARVKAAREAEEELQKERRIAQQNAARADASDSTIPKQAPAQSYLDRM